MEKYSEYKPKLKQSLMEDDDDDDKVPEWPPKSYSCSFCKRELRSAQALGGHMNVHRRDRAKLKRSNNTNTMASSPPPISSSAIIFFQGNSGDQKKGGCKRQRIGGGCGKTVSFMPVQVHSEDDEVQQVVAGMRISRDSSMEDIDLELRVGVK